MENKQNKIVHESHEFLKENPVQDWEKRKNVDGFELLKEQAREHIKLVKEFQDTQRAIEQKFDEKFKEQIQSATTLNIYSSLGKIEDYLRKEGLIRGLLGYPKVEITFSENKILMEITASCISYYNLDDQKSVLDYSSRNSDLNTLTSDKLMDETNEVVTFTKMYKISSGKKLVF